MGIQSRNKVNVSFSMSSMTDIVFLLLIFFIILSTLVSPYGIKVDLPSGTVRTKEQAKVKVTIYPDLRYEIDGQPIGKEELEGMLVAKKDQVAELLIVLDADREVPTGETVSFLSIAKQQGYKVVIATKGN